MNEQCNKQGDGVRVGLKGALFAAANSKDGFVSFYEHIFCSPDIEKRYLIKGGPGTGKSTFMRNAARAAESAGLYVEYYRCSSDPESLDAVVIEGRVAILDATAPHDMSARLAGAEDEIVDIGAFWDPIALERRRDDIKRYTEEKSACYRRAYRFLAAAGAVDDACRSLAEPFIKKEKMRRAAERLVGRWPRGSGFSLAVGLCDSVGMRGRVRLDTYERTADKVYLVRDVCGCGNLFLAMLAESAMKRGHKVRVSYDPIDPSYPDAVLFEELGTAFVMSGGGEETADAEVVSMKRFIASGGKDVVAMRREYKAQRRLFDGLVQSASDCLAKAGEYHFALERIYGGCMDFAALARFCNSFSEMTVARFGAGERN